MSTWLVWLDGLGTVLALMTLVWVASVARRDVSLVDRVWGLTFVVAAATYAAFGDGAGPRTTLILMLVAIWGLRLSIHLTIRNWGKGEDPRYVAMREKTSGNFAARSLVRIFWLQGVLAWLISVPLLGATTVAEPESLTWLDALGVVVWLVGMVFEAGGDWQLKRFLADPANRGKVMDRGLWAYTRHPNYFGDTAVWWGFALIALAAGAWWGIAGAALMTFLIVRVSGVALTESSMSSGSKREGHDEYVRRTNAFIPGPRKD